MDSAQLFRTKGNLEEAEKLCRESLDIWNKLSENLVDGFTGGRARYVIAHIEYERGSMNKAAKEMKESLEIYRRWYCRNPNHPRILEAERELNSLVESNLLRKPKKRARK